MPTIAVLLTCFNRKALTLQCLQHLFNQQGLDSEFALTVFLVDDGCSDGTAEAVQQQFPSVKIITGNGQLYWNGGMRLAWQTALPGKHDFYLWLNDDSITYPDAVRRLLADYASLIRLGEKPGAIAGTVVDPGSKEPTYGGHVIQSTFNHLRVALLPPAPTAQRCDFINGNIALIPDAAVHAIGILSCAYKHGYGDYDYSCRLQKSGFSCWTSSGIYGECAIEPKDYTFLGSGSIKDRLKQVNNIERLYPYRDHMHFVRQCSGKFWPIWWLKAWLRGNCPLLWVLLTRTG